jgi:hypothetical protein
LLPDSFSSISIDERLSIIFAPQQWEKGVFGRLSRPKTPYFISPLPRKGGSRGDGIKTPGIFREIKRFM